MSPVSEVICIFHMVPDTMPGCFQKDKLDMALPWKHWQFGGETDKYANLEMGRRRC